MKLLTSTSLCVCVAVAVLGAAPGALAQQQPMKPADKAREVKTADATPVSTPASSGKKMKEATMDKRFMREAGRGNAAEIQLAELAQKNGESADVKDFAQMMITDHTKANAMLSPIAQKAGLAPFPPAPLVKQQKTYDRMAKLTGAAFDRAYISDAVKDHTKDVSDYQQAAGMVKNPDLNQYVTATLPVIEKHLKSAKEIHAKMMAGGKKS